MIDLKKRIDRLNNILPKEDTLNDYGLLKEIKFSIFFKNLISNSVRYFLYSNLTSWFKNKDFCLSENILEDHIEDILKLPNITPNGLILPKKENIFAYNIVNNNVVHFLKNLKILENSELIQFPINIRLKSGSDSNNDERPRSSTKIHSDIWAGDPASAILIFIPILGDVKYSGIRFFDTKTFPKELVKTLIDFNEAEYFVRDIDKLCDFNNDSVFISDPYLLHKTINHKPGYRISIDFRFTLKNKLSSDFDAPDSRMSSFININQWSQIGENKIMYTDEVLKQFVGDKNISTHNPQYPVRLNILDLRKK